MTFITNNYFPPKQEENEMLNEIIFTNLIKLIQPKLAKLVELGTAQPNLV